MTVNGASTQKIGEFTLRDGALLARPEELGDLGLRVPKDAARTSDGVPGDGTLQRHLLPQHILILWQRHKLSLRPRYDGLLGSHGFCATL